MRKLLLLFISLLIWVIGCSQIADKGEADKPATLSRELTANEKQLVESDRKFSYELFRRTVEEDDRENIFISPLSVSMALGMTLNGAAGETQTAMQEALHIQNMNMQDINKSYSTLIKLLQSADPYVKIKQANSIWARQEFEVDDDFIERCKEFFEARVESLDFSDSGAVDKINEWVSENTEGLIEEIIEGTIPSDVVMYLINAIYFKGDWQYQFDPEETSQKDFALKDGSVAVDMMSQENDLAAYKSDSVQLLDLPYGDSLFTMTLMMPADSETSINNFIQNDLTAENLDYWIDHMSVKPTKAEIPKFEMEYEVTMNSILKAMGMERAFIPHEADFSNMNPDEELYISEVKHKSFVEVDEEGTEAAAVTSVEMRVISAPQIRTLSFDQPFVFLIRERTSGIILFMGKVGNPS